MLNSGQIELMKLVIKAGCIYHFNKEIKDSAFDLYLFGKTPDGGKDDINIGLVDLFYKNSENIDEKDVLHFCVKVFKNHSKSSWLSIAGIFRSDNYINARFKTSKAPTKTFSISASRY